MYRFIILFLITVLSYSANAAVLPKKAGIPVPFVHADTPVVIKHVSALPVAPKKITTVIYPGSLKANIERLAKQFGWSNVIWHLPNDYHWIGKASISANTFSEILHTLLLQYPIKAIFYRGNHVLVILPRKQT